MNSEKILRSIRQHPALWGEHGPEKENQALRIRDKCKARMRSVWQARADTVAYAKGQRILQTWA